MKLISRNVLLALILLTTSFLTTNQVIASEIKKLDFVQEVIPGAIVPEDKHFTEDYYIVSEVTVEEIATDPKIFKEMKEDLLNRDEKGLGQIIMIVDKLLAVGKKIWAIIEAGRPVYTNNFMSGISVLPKTDDPDFTFTQMENWKAPKAITYRVTYKNGFGMNVIEFDYTTMFQYAGTYDGKGAYLTGVTVKASNVSVSWGFSFDANTKLMNIANRGSSSNPLAGATLQIDYTASSVLRTISTSEAFHLTGKGNISKF
ncbi:MAG: hypothetical protein HN576_02785 [Bacteriovoracaceae bacterium]|jgi:hypothetical protein|nr:hypothetical protein [Bacteriovoracaceae bacterium]